MFKKITITMIIVIIFASLSAAKNFHIKKISKDLKSVVVVVEGESELEREVQKGEKIDDWTVMDIQPDHVILRQEPEEEWSMEHQMILRVPSQHIIMENQNILQE